jgi:hypothetical protein
MTSSSESQPARRPLGSLPRRAIRQAGIQAAATRAGVDALRVLREASRAGRPVIVGPWLAEVGFEILYWIPFVHRLRERSGIAPEQLIVLSRGGVASWYGASCGRYVDLYELFEPELFDRLQRERVLAAGGQKHIGMTELDHEALRRLADRDDLRDPIVLHPSAMFSRFRPVWMKRRPLRAVFSDVRFEQPASVARPDGLPDDYVAVKLYASSCLPGVQEARERARDAVRALAASQQVVVLDVPTEQHDHPNLVSASELDLPAWSATVPPAKNLAWQTGVVAHAQRLVSTYGGFAYLAQLYGVTSTGLYWEDSFSRVHVAVANRMVRGLGREGNARDSIVDLRSMTR